MIILIKYFKAQGKLYMHIICLRAFNPMYSYIIQGVNLLLTNVTYAKTTYLL